MDTSSLLNVVSGVGTVQSFLFALLILAKKNKKFPDWILFSWFLVFSIHLLFGMGKNLCPEINLFDIMTMTIGFIHGPFFLLYTKSVINRHWRISDSFHFLPFLVFTLLSFFINENFKSSWEIIILIPKIISLIIYPLYVFYLNRKRMAYVPDKHSSSAALSFFWIKVIVLLFLISIGISVLRMIVELSVGISYFELWDVLRYVMLLTAIGYYGLKYGMVYRPELDISSTPKRDNYKHSPLKKEDIKLYASTINSFIDKNEAYLDPNFSLSTLSAFVDIPKHHLSQIINSEMNTSFYNLINSKRIAYAIRKLKAANRMNVTFEGIGYESGFNTKSSFFRNFKKVTGKTPKEYLKEISAS